MFTITEYCNMSSKNLLLKMSAPPAKKKRTEETEKLIFTSNTWTKKLIARVPQTITGVYCL